MKRPAPLTMLVIVLATSQLPAQSPHASAAARSDLDRFHALFDSLYRRGDAAALATLITDSVVISPIESPDLRGRQAVETVLAGFFTNYTIAQYSLRLEELDVFHDVAYGRGTFVWEAAPRGKPSTRTRGRFAAVYRRSQEGLWRLHRLIENALPT